ncbi:hypothetical protein CASFOL_037303 [Castilleja foliolosa]|uniref:Uncharacterized protein n=1 Tax=Castilleja foliolosa TaxID=1961234 RepID=A0ABD3BN04_9LAMI
MENQGDNSGRHQREQSSLTSSPSRRSLKRKLGEEFDGDQSPQDSHRDLVCEVRSQIEILNSSFSAAEKDRLAAKNAISVLSELARNEDKANVIVDCAAVPALVRYLQTPPTREGDIDPTEYEVEKGSAFTLGLLAIKPEHQQHIVVHGALPHLVNLLKRHKDGLNSQAVCGVIRRAADAITNLAHENSSIKTFVRVDGGIPPLVELLEFADTKVQRSAAGALRTFAFKNDENKNQDNVADLIRVGGVQKLQDGEFIVQVKPFPTNKKYACGAITAALFLKQVKAFGDVIVYVCVNM